MSCVLFVGPTLRRAEIAAICEADCLPPVAQGDVWRAAQRRPQAIGIVDGYFSGAPSVWHKEILWALSEGIPVFGSSSMGALRAAELHHFGMRGVGRIFESFRDGVLEDDDEVAVIHGPAEVGYPPLSEAVVNIRATLVRAEAEGIISASAREGLESYAKSLYFGHRTWSAVLDDGGPEHASRQELAALREWLPVGRIDRKREDALEMLKCMVAAREDCPVSAAPFRFEWTHLWDHLVRRDPGAGGGVGAPSSVDADVLEELRLQGWHTYGHACARASFRSFLARDGRRRSDAVPDSAMTATLRRLRARLGLHTRVELEEWLRRNDMDMSALELLVKREARLTFAEKTMSDEDLADELRLNGDYERLSERARRKKAMLSKTSDAHGAPDAADVTASELRAWFFSDRLGQAMPEDIVIAAQELGFSSLAELDDALRKELVFLRALQAEREDTGESNWSPVK